MSQSATIHSITYKPLSQQDTPGQFLRVAVDTATLIAGYGIEGDRKGGHPKRQINIMSKSTLDALATKGYNTTPGAMGEQIIINGLDVDDLPAGTLLQFGETVRVEVTQRRSGCRKVEAVQGFTTQEIIGQMGIMVRVIDGGQIHTGDPVHLIEKPCKILASA